MTNVSTYLSDTKLAQRYSVSRQTIWRWASSDKSGSSQLNEQTSPRCCCNTLLHNQLG